MSNFKMSFCKYRWVFPHATIYFADIDQYSLCLVSVSEGHLQVWTARLHIIINKLSEERRRTKRQSEHGRSIFGFHYYLTKNGISVLQRWKLEILNAKTQEPLVHLVYNPYRLVSEFIPGRLTQWFMHSCLLLTKHSQSQWVTYMMSPDLYDSCTTYSLWPRIKKWNDVS